MLRDAEVPRWGARKMSPHQNGFNDILALATLHARTPDTIVAIGVQPVTLDDFGGSLTEPVRACLPEAIELAAASSPIGVTRAGAAPPTRWSNR